MDFGLALRDAGEVTMTVDGQILGTPAYMSPEQVRNPHAVDGRSDVHSLGVILYELLTGERPFRGMTRMLLVQVVSDEPRPPRRLNDRIPRDLETICLKCLARQPGRRFRTSGALSADLRRWLAGEPIRARAVGRVERLWLWVKRNPALVVTGGLGAAALTAITGAPVAATLAAVAAAALLFALHQTKAAAELTQAVADLKRHQKKTAAAMQFAFRNVALAREERERAVAAEARAGRRLARARELAHAVLFDLPDKIVESAGPGPAHVFLVRTGASTSTALPGKPATTSRCCASWRSPTPGWAISWADGCTKRKETLRKRWRSTAKAWRSSGSWLAPCPTTPSAARPGGLSPEGRGPGGSGRRGAAAPSPSPRRRGRQRAGVTGRSNCVLYRSRISHTMRVRATVVNGF